MNQPPQVVADLVGPRMPERCDERFGRLWREGQRPDVWQFIAQAGALTDAEVSAILCMDQRQKWQTGERVPAEEYLRNEYGLTVETATDLIYQEFLMREHLGEMPSVEEYRRRFPHHSESLGLQIELHRELGRGGMGVVYRARQWGLNRPVALKVINASSRARPPELVRFLSEAEAVAQLQHPHIVQIYDVGANDGYTYLALDFVDGGSLEDTHKSVPLSAIQAAQTMEKVARAVHFAHQRGIIHRDLKPANILLTADGIPKIADFGLAKRIQWDSELTGAGMLVGTPSYMSPEQAQGQFDEIGLLADIYSLGATLYFLLTGRPPFQADSAIQTLKSVVDAEPPTPRQVNPSVDRDLETICLKCLEKQPSRRYASAVDLADDLDRYRQGRAILARPTTWHEHARRWVRRNPGWAATVAIALALLLILVVGGAVLTSKLQQALLEARGARLPREGLMAPSNPVVNPPG
jgi:hypothetical protein